MLDFTLTEPDVWCYRIDSQSLVGRVSAKIQRLWQDSHNIDPHAEAKQKAVSKKIENIRNVIEDGIHDAC